MIAQNEPDHFAFTELILTLRERERERGRTKAHLATPETSELSESLNGHSDYREMENYPQIRTWLENQELSSLVPSSLSVYL